jgi:hypothetical protein
MATPTFKAKIKDGRIGVYAKDEFHIWLGTLEGQEVDITIKKFRNKRSTRANAYYWVVLTYAGKELGYEPEELHSTFKAMFNSDRTGRLPKVMSTSKLNSQQFSEYLNKVIRRLAEVGFVAPDPSEYYNNIAWR